MNLDLPALLKQKKQSRKIFKSKPVTTNELIETEYYRYLNKIVLTINNSFYNDVIGGIDNKEIMSQIEDESYITKIERLLKQVKSKIDETFSVDKVKSFIQRLINKTSLSHKSRFKTKVDFGFGFDLSKLPEFKQYKQFINESVNKNVSLISSLKEETIGRLEKSLRTAVQKGSSIDTIKKEILKSQAVNKKKAKSIAREEIKQVTSQLNKRRQEDLGIDMYTWIGMNDQRETGKPGGKYEEVTPKHYLMNNLVCRWDDPTVYSDDGGATWKKRTDDMPKDHPGDRIGCRCSAAPYINLDEE